MPFTTTSFDGQGNVVRTETLNDDGSITIVNGNGTTTVPASPESLEALRENKIAANADALRSKAVQALTANAAFLAIASPTQAQTLAQVKLLTKENNALIRLALGLLDDITDT